MILLALAAAVIVPKGEAFTCTPVSVWDGDGPIQCREGPKLRLAGIAAREHDETCRAHQPCPEASGRAARDALVELLGGAIGTTRDGHVLVAGPPLACQSRGPDRYRRTAATCVLPSGAEVGCALNEVGVTLRWPVFDREDRCRPRLAESAAGGREEPAQPAT